MKTNIFFEKYHRKSKGTHLSLFLNILLCHKKAFAAQKTERKRAPSLRGDSSLLAPVT
jgi:hypothetical protein